MIVNSSIISSLENIYISPAEICNLNCRLCYTKKTKNILSNQQILDFIHSYDEKLRSRDFFSTLSLATDSPEKKNYDEKLKLKSILFCGGEVFILPNFIDLINQLISSDIFITIITNGTVDKLDYIKDPQNCQLLVSLDGPKEIHDQNRGQGNFDKSVEFIKHAHQLGFPTEIMFLITPKSYPTKDEFQKILKQILGFDIKINYITQKTIFYTENHPLSNQNNKQSALNRDQIIDIKKNYSSVPGKHFGCFQLALQSNGQIYGCCESPFSLGKIDDDPKIYIQKFIESLSACQKCNLGADVDNVFLGEHKKEEIDEDKIFRSGISEQSEGLSTAKILSSQSIICHGCCCPEFLCGYKKELNQINCKEVVKLFQ